MLPHPVFYHQKYHTKHRSYTYHQDTPQHHHNDCIDIHHYTHHCNHSYSSLFTITAIKIPALDIVTIHGVSPPRRHRYSRCVSLPRWHRYSRCKSLHQNFISMASLLHRCHHDGKIQSLNIVTLLFTITAIKIPS